MTQWRTDLQGRGPMETLSRAGVQAMGDAVQLALGITRQVGALGQILAQQPLRVLVGTTLPGAARIGKEHPDRERLGQALVQAISFASIIGQGCAQRRGHVPELVREPVAGTPRIRALQRVRAHSERARSGSKGSARVSFHLPS